MVNAHRVRRHTVVGRLRPPQGILVDGQPTLRRRRRRQGADRGRPGQRGTAAPSPRGLPVGAPPGVVPKPLKGMPPFSGPQGPFAGIAAGPDGTLYVSADADGSVLAFRRDGRDD